MSPKRGAGNDSERIPISAVYQQLDDHLGQDEEPYDVGAGLQRLLGWMGDETPQRASEEASDRPTFTKANRADHATADAAEGPSGRGGRATTHQPGVITAAGARSPRSRRAWGIAKAAAVAAGILVAAEAERQKARQAAESERWKKARQAVQSADESDEYDHRTHHDTATT